MLRRLMNLALKERGFVIIGALILTVAGYFAFRALDIEAYPDPVQPEIELTTQPYGMSAEEVEKLVTVPLEWGLAGMRNISDIRTISLFGLSDVKLYFSWDSNYYWDKVETLNRLQLVNLPLPGVAPGINPDNPIGEIYRYRIISPNHDLMAEKEIQDWVVEKQLKTVPGVLDVAGFGGLTKEYHVNVDPDKLVHYGISLPMVTQAVADANSNVGGSYLPVGSQAFDVRGIGFIRSLDDIRDITLATVKGTPIRVSDVATVQVGHAPRLGIVGFNNLDDAVEGIVLMRKYGNTLETLKGVEKKVAQLNASGMMPPGFKIIPYYDRTQLVDVTLHTVFENLAVGMILVLAVLIVFLGDLRTACIVAINVPLSMCGAFILLYLTGTSANLLSLGAIDFGILIGTTIIVVENVFRHMVTDRKSNQSDWQCISNASEEVSGPILYSTIIFLIAFLPLFTMTGVEGAIFSPMSRTYAFALSIAILLAVTLSPVLCSYALHQGIKERSNAVWEKFQSFYHDLFVKVLKRPRLTVGAVCTLMAAGLALFPFLGAEFLPKLEEGNIWARATMPLTISLGAADKLAEGARRDFLSFPEVRTVVSQLGRPDDGSDTSGFFNAEFFVDLKSRSQWPSGMTKDKLIGLMNAKLRRDFPWADFGYSQNIEDNVEEALSGVKGENAVKVFGPDLVQDESVANQVAATMKQVRGIQDVAVYRSLGQPNLLIVPNRRTCARYGLNVGDVNAVVQAAIGGQAVTQVLEGDRAFNLIVRLAPDYRQSLAAIRRIPIALPSGGYVLLGQVANIRMTDGASFIYRENLRRYVPVRFSVRGRDMSDAIEAARRRIASSVKIPRSVNIDWAGEYGEMTAANRRLAVIVPIALFLIAGVLYWTTLSLTNTLILMAQVPLACLGGIAALAFTRTPFSISAAVGFISIFAIAIMDGLLLNSYIFQLWNQGYSLIDSIVKGADRRFRALIMTALVDGLGLLPAALSTRIGAQTQRPLAIVVIGGCCSIALLTRVFQPTLVYLFHRQLGLTEELRPAARTAS